eukprot:scaffold206613_cov26-Tisochrysis_lutea.AAC.4
MPPSRHARTGYSSGTALDAPAGREDMLSAEQISTRRPPPASARLMTSERKADVCASCACRSGCGTT